MQTASVFSKIGNGFKQFFQSSGSEVQSMFVDTRMEGYARIEASIYFGSTEIQNDFMSSENSEGMQFVKSQIDFLRQEMERYPCCFVVPHQKLVDTFFSKNDGFQNTIIAVGNFSIVFMYGFNNNTQKIFGMWQRIGPKFDIDAAIRRYALPQRPYTVIKQDRAPCDYFNDYKFMQVPLMPLNNWNRISAEPTITLPSCMEPFIVIKRTKRQIAMRKEAINKARRTAWSIGKPPKPPKKIKPPKTFRRCRELIQFDGWYRESGGARKLKDIKRDDETPAEILALVNRPELLNKLCKYISRNNER